MTDACHCCIEFVCGSTFLAPSINGQVREAADRLVGPDFIPVCFVSVEMKVFSEMDMNLEALF